MKKNQNAITFGNCTISKQFPSFDPSQFGWQEGHMPAGVDSAISLKCFLEKTDWIWNSILEG